MAVRIERSGSVWTVIHSRPEARNAMDASSADDLVAAFEEFDADASANVAVFWGEGGAFCAGVGIGAAAEGGGAAVAWAGAGGGAAVACAGTGFGLGLGFAGAASGAAVAVAEGLPAGCSFSGAPGAAVAPGVEPGAAAVPGGTEPSGGSGGNTDCDSVCTP